MEDQFAADLAASKAATAAKYASSSKTSSGGGSGGSGKDKYQDKSSNYYRIQKQAAGYDDVEDVQAYLDRMIDQGYITAEEAAEKVERLEKTVQDANGISRRNAQDLRGVQRRNRKPQHLYAKRVPDAEEQGQLLGGEV